MKHLLNSSDGGRLSLIRHDINLRRKRGETDRDGAMGEGRWWGEGRRSDRSERSAASRVLMVSICLGRRREESVVGLLE